MNLASLIHHPRTRALLDAIARFEAIQDDGRYGYASLHSSIWYRHPEHRFNPDTVADHPYLVAGSRIPVVPSDDASRGSTSSPAGRYQFVRTTWRRLKAKYGFSGFSPSTQDLAALALADEQGVVEPLVRARAGAELESAVDRAWRALRSIWHGLVVQGKSAFADAYFTSLRYWEGLAEQGQLEQTVAQFHQGIGAKHTARRRPAGQAAPRRGAYRRTPYRSLDGSPIAPVDPYHIDDPAVLRAATAAAPKGKDLLARLDVYESEEPPLLDLKPPADGEIDIGDIRLGSPLQDPESGLFRDADDPQLNQVTSMTQQNIGSVGVVEMLRTEMNPVLGDNRVLPEVSITIQLNATYRDDVNRVLRPLVAQTRRVPFTAIRNADVARIMLGIGPSQSYADYVREQSPDLYAEIERNPEELARLHETTPSEIWVPVTIRSLTVQSQPGARDLYQVTLGVQYANVFPYVPRLTFWRKTSDAIAWARYIGQRSIVGALVTDVTPGHAKQILPGGEHVQVDVPTAVADASAQVSSPHQSYVFKKFYRGLLEEWQGTTLGTYRLHRLEGRLEEIYPIGTSVEGDLVYEPAYPIADAGRLMEVYNPTARMSLGYITAADQATRQVRMQRLEQAFARRMTDIQIMRRAASVYGRRESFGDGLQDLGDISPWRFVVSQDLGIILSNIGMTVRQYGEVLEQAIEAVNGRDPALKTDEYAIEVGPGGQTIVRHKTGKETTIPSGSAASRLVEKYRFRSDLSLETDSQGRSEQIVRGSDGSVAGFAVQDPERRHSTTSFSRVVRDLEVATVAQVALLVSELERLYTDPVNLALEEGAPVAQQHARARQAREFFSRIYQRPDAAEYLLSLEFLVKDLPLEPWFDERGRAKLRELETLLTAMVELNAEVARKLEQAKEERAQVYLAGNTRREEGFLDLTRSTQDSISIRIANRFADKDWDGYPHPVQQHIGGSGAEVSIDITTDDPVLLAQLSELKHSQIALAELRKHRGVTPPLIEVYGEGCFLRSLGIRKLAYRTHTVFEDKDAPGFMKVRLELIQDEETLVRTERFDRVGGSLGVNLFHTEEVLPLLLPTRITRGDARNPFEPGGPLSVADLFRTLYGTAIPGIGAPSRPAGFDAYQLSGIDLHAYDAFPGLTTLQEDYLPLKVTVRYVPKGSRGTGDENRYFDVEFIHRTPGGGTAVRRLGGGLNALLNPIGRFLDFCHSYFPAGPDAHREQTLSRLTGAVEQALSTTGYSQGYVMGLVMLGATMIDAYLASKHRAFASARPVGPGGGYGTDLLRQGLAAAEDAADNLSKTVSDLFTGQPVAGTLAAVSLALKSAADDLARAIISNEALRELYKQYLSTVVVPGPRGPVALSQTTSENGIFNWAHLITGAGDGVGTIDALAALFSEIQQSVPTCYPDLLMPELRDPVTETNILGYDFPYGPGATDLGEDALFSDYLKAEDHRLAAAVQLASVGVDVIYKHIQEDEGTAPGIGAEHEREANRKAHALVDQIQAAVARGDTEEAERLQEQFIEAMGRTPLARQYAEAVARLRPSNDFSGDLLKVDLASLASYGVFTGVPLGGRRELLPEQWGDILRISQTIQYVTYVNEIARMEGKPFEAKIKEIDASAGAFIEASEGLSVASNSVRVQQDPRAASMRNQLQRLYQADPSIVAAQLGYTDLTAEPYRKMLTDKVRSQWTRWIGMRRAFPSYALLVTGPVGSPFYRILADIYSWGAVQRIDIRNQAKSAGQTCELVLSNMRNRLSNPLDRSSLLLLADNIGDLMIELTPGTHMNVFVGYGPDIAHLYPFSGRVVSYQPGPVTQVTLSSYSATLNNPPNKGAGFYTSGWDGSQTLQDVVFYTIAQTDGLEGLGRGVFGSIVDMLGRSDRGSEADEYKMSVLLGLYKAFGSPGLDKALEQAGSVERQQVSALLDAARRLGVSSMKELTMGSPRLYENIMLSSTPGRAGGFGELVFGGLREWLVNGDGWGWASLPGETCWAILHDIAKLWPDYIVTTRPYNVGTSLKDLAKHPLRQTLYFGPRHGSYVATSSPKKMGYYATDTFRGQIEELIADYFEGELDGSPKPETERYERLRRLYMEIFFEPIVWTQTLDVLQTQDPAWAGELYRGLSNNTVNGISAFFAGLFNGIESAAQRYNILDEVSLSPGEGQQLIRHFTSLFPRTMSVIGESGIFDRLFEVDLQHDWFGGFIILPEHLERGAKGFLRSGLTWASRTAADYRRLLDEFQRDLAELAVSGQMYVNMRGGATGYGAKNHPLLDYLQAKAREAGILTDSEFRPITEHHALSVYTEIISNGIRASDDDPEFFNQVTLQFPQDPDERLSAFQKKGGVYEFTVSASPLIHPDFLKNDTVYYPNVRYNWDDVVGLVAAQNARPDGRPGPFEILEEMNALRERILAYRRHSADRGALVPDGRTGADGRVLTIQQALAIDEPRLMELERLLQQTPYVKPKYQTVGVNILQDRLRNMYSGTLLLAGDPRIQPYHVLHVWDDVKQMHGPVEVEDVLHSYSTEGFYTAVTPKLVTFHRGVDQTIDTMYLDWVSGFYGAYTMITRGLGGLIGAASAAGTAYWAAGAANLGFSWTIASGAAGTAFGFSGPLLGGSIALAGPIAIGVAVAAAAYAAVAGGRSMAEQYAGYVGDVLNTNPIVFVPLTHKQIPYVAGLTGAVGPSSLRAAIAASVDIARRQGNVRYVTEWYKSIFTPNSLRER